jgi:molybdopterin-guanine dinucleotide biosynthesis protein A
MDIVPISGLILAGGRGQRMGGVDKGLVLLDGVPLVAHVARRLHAFVQELLISANRNQDRYATYGAVVADDPELGPWLGPLAGVAAGLAAAQTPWLVTAPCDVPGLPHDLVARLQSALSGRTERIAVACAGGRREPVCMLLSTALLPELRAYLAEGGRKVDTWQTRVGCVEVDFDDEARAFHNINTTAELERAGAYTSQWRKS